MQIPNDWQLDDPVTGLRLRVVEGQTLDQLHIEFSGDARVTDNRDYFFTKSGKFDGTGSCVD